MRFRFLLISIFIFCSLTVSLSSQSKIRAAVMDFTTSNVSKAYSEELYEFFSSRLADSNAFLVVERRELNRIIAEQNLQLSDEFDESTAVQLGNFLGAELMIMGRISEVSGKISITVRGVNTETAVIAFSKTIMPENKGNIVFDSISLLVREIAAEATGIDISKYEFIEKQARIEEINFRINSLKSDIFNLEVSGDYFEKMQKIYMGGMIFNSVFAGVGLAGSVISFVFYNDFILVTRTLIQYQKLKKLLMEPD